MRVAQPDPGDLAAIGARLEVRQRAHARVERRPALAVEVRDDVGQVGLARRAVEPGAPGRSPRSSRSRPRSTRRRSPPPPAGDDASRRDQPARCRAAAPGRRCRRPRASWVTSTTARPSSAAARSRRSTSAPASTSRLPVGSSASRTAGVVDERPRDREALLLAAGELGGKRVRDGPQPEPVDELAAAPLGVRVGAAHAPREQHVRLARSARAAGGRTGTRSRRGGAAACSASAPRRPSTRSPPSSISPASARSSPPSRCSSVDLPEPERPSTATTSPAATSRSAPSRMRRAARPSPKLFTSPCTLTAAIR